MNKKRHLYRSVLVAVSFLQTACLKAFTSLCFHREVSFTTSCFLFSLGGIPSYPQHPLTFKSVKNVTSWAGQSTNWCSKTGDEPLVCHVMRSPTRSQDGLMWMLELLSSTFLMKGSMHLSPPMKRYVATLASQGSNLGKEREASQINILLCLNASPSIPSVSVGWIT